jgi:hypothetical protein
VPGGSGSRPREGENPGRARPGVDVEQTGCDAIAWSSMIANLNSETVPKFGRIETPFSFGKE